MRGALTQSGSRNQPCGFARFGARWRPLEVTLKVLLLCASVPDPPPLLPQAQLARVAAEADLRVPFADDLPSRQAQLAALQSTEEFDVLVVGGGATGAGCALDAVTRSKSIVNPKTVSFFSFFFGPFGLFFFTHLCSFLCRPEDGSG